MLNGNPLSKFADAIRAAGLTAPDHIDADGELHRFASNGKRSDDAGWYVFHADGIAAGSFGDWRTGQSHTWRADVGRKLSHVEASALAERAEQARHKRQADEARRHAEARECAAAMWQEAAPASPDHPYLIAKSVRPHGIRERNGELLIPMREGGELYSLQRIKPDGGKRYLSGGRVTGCYFAIGKPGDVLLIAEGYATAASLYESIGLPVAVAFDAGNLRPVAEALHAKLPDIRIIVCADDDYRTACNPGITKATEAALAVGGFLAVPHFGADRPEGATDFNDLARHRGAEAVERAIANARAPDVSIDQPARPNAIAGDAGLPDVALIRGDTITPEPIRWIWTGWIAAGKFHVLAGQPGGGKTTLAVGFAATISSGGRWPDGTHAEPGNVIIWTGEDDPKDTLAPRLLAMNADMARIHFVGHVREGIDARPFDPANDIAALVRKAEAVGNVRLLIVDPVVSAVAGDSHKNAETRRSLQPLVDLALRLDCAVLGISHLTKGTSGREPIERVTGSLAFAALARIVLIAAKLPEDRPEGGPARMLARAKSNIGPDSGGFGYDLQHAELAGFPGVVASRVLWGAAIDGTARELLARAEQVDEEGGGPNAREFLLGMLEPGPMLASDVFRDAKAHGFSDRQMQRARSAIGARIDKQGMRGGWEWSLPKMPLTPEDAEDTEQNCLAPSAPSAESLAYRARRG